MAVQQQWSDVPNPQIYAIVEAYEQLAKRSEKRAKKAVKMRIRLKEALALEAISSRYSFLSFYNIIEIVADDLIKEQECRNGTQFAQEIVRYALAGKSSQRLKIYFLLNAFPNDFVMETALELAELRNNLTHADGDFDHVAFQLCKKIALWSSATLAVQLTINGQKESHE
ncbi:hypothetical protein GTP44_26000 [Duganella sp. FT50W]|uniref:RiboL-PSP-HEPN domain-containing protein n=1 Tax=Duganella lactea TaxID=2692173 RepID=A0A6L8MTQ5_9BURK|nr:hypothetical protein [Duganella lactea]MYM85374.1 hypothetical protein [Duganella lactea]